MMLSGRTRVFALLGDPVSHSLSPRMHNAAFAVLGLDAVYVALRTAPEGVRPLMEALVAAGGGGNVTVPHKTRAAQAVGGMRGPVAEACNTFWGEDGSLVGCNTDVDGVLGALGAIGALAGKRWLVIGTGGSAIAIAAAAREVGAALDARSRSVERAARFLASARELGVPAAGSAACDVVINATPLGLAAGDALPVDPASVPAARWALDLVYTRSETPWVRAMRARGAVSADGREVLVRQGAASLERWFPSRRAPVEVMRAAVRAGLG